MPIILVFSLLFKEGRKEDLKYFYIHFFSIFTNNLIFINLKLKSKTIYFIDPTQKIKSKCQQVPTKNASFFSKMVSFKQKCNFEKEQNQMWIEIISSKMIFCLLGR